MQWESECRKRDIAIATLDTNLTHISSRNLELEQENTRLREIRNQYEQEKDKYNALDLPVPLAEIELRMKTLPEVVVKALVEYLKFDSLKLVQNLAQVTNRDNVSEIIAYRDGALGRNEALIERLSKIQSKTVFTDRIEWEVKGKS